MTSTDRDYYARRAIEEAHRAAIASCRKAASAHGRMALEYEARAQAAPLSTTNDNLPDAPRSRRPVLSIV